MAGTTVSVDTTGMLGSDVYQIRLELNRVIDDMETLRAAFMAHTHRTPTTNPGSTSTPNTDAGGAGSTGGTASTAVATAATLTGAKVSDTNGNTTR
jgi:hypothetical protein